MNVKKLNAYDFPGIDIPKFNEWKELRLKVNREVVIVVLLGVAFLSIWYFVLHVKSNSIIPILVAMIPGMFSNIRRKRERQLKEELKISERWQAKNRAGKRAHPYLAKLLAGVARGTIIGG